MASAPGFSNKSDDVGAQFSEWFEKNSRTVLLAATIIAVGGIGTYLYVRSADIRATRAQAQYEEAQRQVYSGTEGQGAAALEAVATRYGGTNAGALAALRLAGLRLEQRQFGEALKALSLVEGSSKMSVFGSATYNLKGAALSDSGAYLEAAAAYEAAAAAATSNGERSELRLRAATMYQLGNAKDEALAIFQALSETGTPEVMGVARRRAGALMATPA